MPARRGVERAAAGRVQAQCPIQEPDMLINRHFSRPFGFWTAAKRLRSGIRAERRDGPRKAAHAADVI
jgi:hypothetical protein